jgi:hypothetical protein
VRGRWVGLLAAAGVYFITASARADEAIEDGYGDGPSTASVRYPWLVLGEATFLGAQSAYYWGVLPKDDKIHFNWSTWEHNVTSVHSLVLDEDRFNVGAIGHAIDGTVYYQIARGYGLGPLGSFLTSVGAELIWQYVSEWDTKPATNDVIGTPLAGWVIGEASYRVGQFFAEGEPGVINCVGAAVFAPVATFNDRTVCGGRRAEAAVDNAGPRRSAWHHFELGVGAGETVFVGAGTRTETSLYGEGRIVTNTAYGRPGTNVVTARPGQWTGLASRWLVADERARGGFFHADSLLVGRYARRYSETDPGVEPNGWGALVGLGSTFDYDTRDLPTMDDRTASIGVVGPVGELRARRGIVALRARVAATYGLAQVTSLAYPAAMPVLATQSVRGVLAEHGYYYAQAVLPSATVEADAGALRLVLDGRGASYWSIDHDDPNQSQLRNGFALWDGRLNLAAAAAVRPFHGPVSVGVAAASADREGHAAGYAATVRERRLTGDVDMTF